MNIKTFHETYVPNNKTILKVKQLTNSYEGEPVVQDVSFSLQQGEILCLLGPSGSGKTTLLRLLAGLEKEDEGSIVFNEKNIHSTPPHKRNFGMMFQEYALFPHKSVQENVAFGLEMQQCSKKESAKRVKKMLTLVGLSGLEHRKIDELSGGERQRVALARSLAPEPQLLLLDEPLGSLDRALRDRLTVEIRTILKSLAVTAVFVTHDQTEAFSIADKVAILHQGHLEQFDTPENLYRRPAGKTVARFLGFTNIIAGHIDSNCIFHSSLGELDVQETVIASGKIKNPPRTSTNLLLRPEGARIVDTDKVDAAEHNHRSGLLTGKVTGRQFQGGSYKLSLLTGDCSLCFDLPLEPAPPQPGEQITLRLKASSIVCIDN